MKHDVAIKKILFVSNNRNETELNLDGLFIHFLNLKNNDPQLRHLESISLSQNFLCKVPGFISELKSLRSLDLSANNIHEFPKEIKHHEELRFLNLSNNSISKLPNDILEYEICRNDELKNNSNPAKTNSKALEKKGSSIFEETKQQLRKILNIPEFKNPRVDINDLTTDYLSLFMEGHSRTISLKGAFSFIRDRNFDYPNYEYSVRLYGNLFLAPVEMYKKRPSELFQYILDLQNAPETKPLHEAKLIFLGSGFVGKTSLIKMLTGKGYNSIEEKTDGIEITELSIKKENNDVKLNIWDFGGQEIMHATHKFFLTKRSIYVLVINPRTEDKYGESELEYWLKMIISFAGFVPVVIVINKCETHPIDIGFGALKDKYPSIVDFVKTSCKENIGIGKLRLLIENALFRVKHIDEKLPISYFKIKDHLEKINKDYLQYSDYERICRRIDPIMTNKSHKILVGLLHDLGIMLNFSENRLLHDTQVLNPEWVTQGVYSIITSSVLINQKGIITIEDTRGILDREQYPSIREHRYILDIMQYFELAYSFEFQDVRCFIPGAFPKDRPDFSWKSNSDNRITFIFQYDVLPKSIISRFLVKIFRLIRDDDYWRTGVVIEYNSCIALIYADLEERWIKIEITGEGGKRDLLSIIREKFDDIHASFNGLEIAQYIDYYDYEIEQSVKVNYDDLIIHHEENKEYIFVPSIRKDYVVSDLLFGIDNNYKSINKLGILSYNQVQTLKALISNNLVAQFFEDCINIPSVRESSFYNEIILLYSRFNKVLLEQRLQLLDKNESSIEFSKINKGIVDLLDLMIRK